MPDDDRTEPATPKKRAELRRRGRVCKSQDLGSIVCFLGIIMALHAFGGVSAAHMKRYLLESMAVLQAHPDLTYQSVGQVAYRAGTVVVQALAPFAGTALLLGILVNGLQTGFIFAPEAMKPDLLHLNPLTGMQRLVSGRGVFEAAKAIFKIAIVFHVAVSTISDDYSRLLMTGQQPLPTAIATVGDILYRLALRTTILLLVLSAVDYGYQRWQFEKSIRMTKQEIKEETKSSEGSPMTKGRQRSKIRQMYRKIMKGQVAKADVVVTNPTHFAVALRYDASTMSAPVVVAKGADFMAAHIRELAKQHDVPIVENPPLARALFKAVDIGEEVPGNLYTAVAELLAYVYQIDRRRKPSAWATA